MHHRPSHYICISALLCIVVSASCESESEQQQSDSPQTAGAIAARSEMHVQPQEPRAGGGPAADDSPRPQIPDVRLIDQHGKRHRFYTDLVKGKLVIMNAMFTSCAGSCPVQAHIFSELQRMLGERLGADIQMISVSLDPVTDTPEQLAEFAKKYDAGPGWVLLTGPRADVTSVLQAMDLYAADPREHTPIAVIGNEPQGIWMKTINLSTPFEIARKLEYVASLHAGQALAQ